MNIYNWYILKQWIALKVRSDWLVKLRISFAIYLRATGKMVPICIRDVKKSSTLVSVASGG